jgi:hypothetical protein
VRLRGIRRLLSRVRPTTYLPERYWEDRAPELVEVYDAPETWDARGWMRGGIEESVVPSLLRQYGVRTVIVPGAGSGRQYSLLEAEGFEPRGFDISPSLVAVCRERYPAVPTHLGSVVDADMHESPADAVFTSGVLQHVPPHEIGRAIRALRSLAGRMIVIRELTLLAEASPYQFPHDYEALFEGWTEIHRKVTDERQTVRVELIAWTPAT